MKSKRSLPPIWLIGLSNSTLGLNTGVVFFVMPQLLAAQHVPEVRIAGITAAAMSANFWSMLFGPILDVRFSRRWYATCLAVLSAALAALAVLNLHRLEILEAILVLGVAAGMLSSTALGGWLSAVCRDGEKNKLSAWLNISVICGTGIASAAGGELVRHLAAGVAATVLASMLVLPAVIFLFIPAPGPDRRLAGESFRQFVREIFALLRRREVLIALLLFVTPCSSFALPDIFGGLGADFHASARLVSMAGGMGAFAPGILGCLLFPILAKRLSLRFFYLANGILGCLFTLSLILMPRTPAVFVFALVGEYLFQAIAFSIQIGITFETIGPNNPLAATTFTFLSTATNIPVTYMVLIDGHGYALGGVAGALAMDGAIGVVTCLLLGLLLYRLRGKEWASFRAAGNSQRALP